MTHAAHDEPQQHPCGRFDWERIVRRVSPDVLPWEVKGFAFLLPSWGDLDGSRIRPGMAMMRAVTGKSESTLRRWMRLLHKDLGLLMLTRRGGGKGGTGKTAEYRLALPTDLLERVVLLDPTELSPVTLVTGQSVESSVTQMTGQSVGTPVDDAVSPVIQVTDETGNHRSLVHIQSPMTGQIQPMTGHPDDQLPGPLPGHKRDQGSSSDPAQLTTAHDRETNSPPAVQEIRSRKCEHGLVRRNRPDGTPACALCRRQPPSTQDPPCPADPPTAAPAAPASSGSPTPPSPPPTPSNAPAPPAEPHPAPDAPPAAADPAHSPPPTASTPPGTRDGPTKRSPRPRRARQNRR